MMCTTNHRSRQLTFAMVAFVAALTLSMAATACPLHVPSQYPTIQDAIDAAGSGCEIIVADGVDSGAGNTDIDFQGKAITVRSAKGPADCIIGCKGNSRAFTFNSNETSSSVIRGFTVSFSNIMGGYPGTGNINADPLFVNAAGCNLRLRPGSPCIDTGDNSALPPDCADLDDDGNTAEPTPVDLDMNPRILNYVVDMGAYEFRDT